MDRAPPDPALHSTDVNVARAINAALAAQRARDLQSWHWSTALTHDQRMAIQAYNLFGWPIIPS